MNKKRTSSMIPVLRVMHHMDRKLVCNKKWAWMDKQPGPKLRDSILAPMVQMGLIELINPIDKGHGYRISNVGRIIMEREIYGSRE